MRSLRISEAQWQAYRAAADLAGLTLVEWITKTLDKKSRGKSGAKGDG